MFLRSFSLGEIDEVGRRVHVVASTRDPVKGWEPPKDAHGMATERLEALESWDLSRYPEHKGVPILWQHDAWSGSIGFGEDVRQTDRGLEMWIAFHPANVEPKADEAWTRVKAKVIRFCSVGFEFGERTDETRDGQRVAVFRNNVLLETSLVTIPADPRAGVAAPRVDAADVVCRFDVAALGKFERTPTGGVKVPARLTRTGVLAYRLPDGTIRRELRLPEEVFKADSLASLEGATVTDIEHHRGLIGPHNWKDAALGSVRNIRRDSDKYVAGDVSLEDAAAIAELEAGRLADISCGYACKLDPTTGEWNGERYDAIQRNIRYNHVAVLPPGRGRAGTDVALRLDANDAVCVDEQQSEKPMKTIRIDGKDYEIGSDAHLAKVDEMHKADLARADAKCQDLQKQLDEAQAKFDASERAAKKAADEAKEEEKKTTEERKAQFRARLRLVMRAMRYMEEDDDEEKMDALESLSDREIMLKVIRADDADFSDKDKSDDYVRARFDMVDDEKLVARSMDSIEKKVRTDSVDSVVRTAEALRRTVRADADDVEAEAKRRMVKRNQDRWKEPVGFTVK